jgi:RimJ/RimL family protein N-acetyltransferase
VKPGIVLETPRLRLRRFTIGDAPFVLRLLNEPSFVQHIGDRGVHSLDDAESYIRSGPLAMYDEHGFGLWVVEDGAGAMIGICGLLRRPTLEDVDIGYALLPEHWGRGYAAEAARGVLAYAKATLGLNRVVAIVSPGNVVSIAVLAKLGMRFERVVRLTETANPVELYATDW